MLSRVAADIRHAVTAMRRRPAALAVPVLTIAIGIGASTAIFSALYAALFSPLPYSEPGRLVMGRATFSGEINPWASAPDFYDYRERATVFEALSAYRPSASRVNIRTGDGGQSLLLTQVSWDFFTTLGVSPALGRLFDPTEGERGGQVVAIVTDGYWKRSLGGAKDVVGRAIPLDLRPLGIGAVTVVGILPPTFRFAYDADVYLPLQRNSRGNDVRRFHNWMLLGRLRPGVPLAEAQRQVDGISTQLEKEHPDSNRNKALLLTPLQEALAEGDRPNLLILMAAVAVLLLVACADVAGLLLSRGAARQAEMAIRSALGATRARLGGQLLAESLLVATAAGALGLVLAYWLRGLVLRVVPLDSLGVTTLPLGTHVLAFGGGVTILTSLLVGTVPAWLTARSDLSSALKGGSRTTETASRAIFRQALVALQVAMSVVLLAAAALLGRSLLQLRAVDPGFDPAHLLSAQVQLVGDAYATPAARVRFFDGLLEDVRALPGVMNANIVNMVPIQDRAGNIPAWDADHPPAQPSEAPVVCARYVFPGYFATMGIPLVAGRDLTKDDSGVLLAGAGLSASESEAITGPPPIVVSQSVARKLFPTANPLGKRLGIFTGGAKPTIAEVVGVVGDVHMNSLGGDYTLAMYLPYQVVASPMTRVVLRTAGDPAAVVPAVRAALARRDRGLVLNDVKTMEQVLDASLEGFSLRAGAVVLFGAATLLLAMIGVYGVLAFTVSMRRQDIALRIVVGASRRHVLAWVMTRGLTPVGVGLVLGLAGAFWSGRWLQAQLFNVPPSDPVAFAGVVACLAGTAVAACLVPAWRAMHVDPIVALRAE